ncbi:MAG TPA: helix-turn-helix transcriptional regulator [Acidobacteriota bacterium]|nr:helix-turn-helix transcriptional regulator [Acidobacteriota bacterium]
MNEATRITFNGALVLQALASGYRYGFEIMDYTRLASGTAYPILRRYEAAGLVESHWEDTSKAHSQGRPRRRYYQLSAQGEKALRQATRRIRAQQRIFQGLEPESR